MQLPKRITSVITQVHVPAQLTTGFHRGVVSVRRLMAGKLAVLIFMRRTGLTVYSFNTKELKTIDLPDTVLKHHTILDEKVLTKVLADELTKLPPTKRKHKVIIVLTDEILFPKTIDDQSAQDLDKLKEQLLSAIPLKSVDIGIKEISVHNARMLVGAHKPYFEMVKHVVEQLHCHVVAVVPITLFQKDDKPISVTKEQCERMILDFLPSHDSNFLVEPQAAQSAEVDELLEEESLVSKLLSHKKNLIALVVFLLAFGMLMFLVARSLRLF